MIDRTATIINSSVSPEAKIYRNVILRNSTIESNCIIGDLSRVDNSIMEHNSQIYPFGTMYYSKLGAFSYAQKNCSIWHANIGKYCSLSWNVSVGGGNHDFNKVTTHSFLYASSYGFVDEPMYDRFDEECNIGNDVWIAADVSVLRNVSVGDGAVVGAGAIVTKDVEPYSIVAGVPAKKIGQRCDDELVGDLLQIKWWDWPEDIIKTNISVFNEPITRKTIELLQDINNNLILT